MISFRSKVTIKVLDYFFINPDEKHYINELAKMFSLDPKNVDVKLKELEKTDSWQRSEYVEKQGWATMPGEEKPDSKVAAECTRLLVLIGK